MASNRSSFRLFRSFGFCSWNMLLGSQRKELVQTRSLASLKPMSPSFITRTKKMGMVLFSLHSNTLTSSTRTNQILTRESLASSIQEKVLYKKSNSLMTQSSISSPSPLVWFLLLDSVTGKPYMGTTASSILRSRIVVPIVDQFREAIIKKYKDEDSNILTGLASSQLSVYENKNAFDQRNAEGKQEPLKPSCKINGLGATEEEALIVVVPNLQKGKISLIQQLLRCLFFLMKK